MSRQRLFLRKHMTLWTLCCMVLLSLVPAPIAAQVGTQPEASGQVIAQGIDTLPRGDLNWRVIDSDALPGDEANFGERSLGFAYAIEDPVIVTSLTTGQNALISQGQAHFSAEGSDERRSSPDNRASGYLSIELTTEEAASAPGAEESSSLLFLGEPFRSPRADHNIQLTRAVSLPAEEASFTPENDLPFLLIVTDGVLQITPSDGDSVELGAGSFTEFTDEIEILAGANQGATWLIASVGSEVDIPPVPTPAPSTKTGTLEIQLELCPDGFDDACEPTTTENVTVPAFHNIEDKNWIIPDRADVSDDETTYTYKGLPAGRYTTGPEEDAPDNVNLDGARWSDDNEGWDFRIRADRTTTLRLQVIPETNSDTGSIVVTLYDCPEGSDPASSTSDCATSSDPWNIPFSPTGASSLDDVLRLLDDATDLGDGTYLFEDLPAVTWEFSPDNDGPEGPLGLHVEGDAYLLGDNGMWAIDLEPGDNAEVFIYRVLSSETTGSLFITLYDCPDGSDPTTSVDGCEISSDPWNVGVSNIGQSSRDDWTLFNDAIDMGDGTWWFELLPATPLSIFPAGLEPSGEFDVYVSGDVEGFGDDTWVVTIPGAGAAEISLYRVYPGDEPVPTEEPTTGTGSLVITQYDCPYGTDIAVDTSPCELTASPWDVLVTNLDTGESLLMMIDGVAYDSGTYVFESLPAGTYSVITMGNGNWSVSHPTTVAVTADDETYLTIYSVDLREP